MVRPLPVEALERLDALLRAAPKQGQLSDQAREELGWSASEARDILRALNFAPTTRPKEGEPVIWRRRNEKRKPQTVSAPPPNSPFAALAALKEQPAAAARRPRRRRKAKAVRA